METEDTTSNIEGTATLHLEHWVKANTLPFFWKALTRELDAGKTYDECVRHMQGYFKAGNGAPTGRDLRAIVNRMVQTKEAPSDFLSAWDRRRGREPASAAAPNGTSSEPAHVTTAVEVESTPGASLAMVERTDVVNGWPLAVIERESIPFIEDEELGRRLGYADPRMVRKLVRRIFNDSELMSTVSQRGGRPATVYLLKQNQALKVAMRSETRKADAIQDEIIAVYEAWLDARPRVAPATISIDVARLDAFLATAGSFFAAAEKRDAALRSIATSALDAANGARAEIASIDSRLAALERKGSAPKKARPVSRSGLPAMPEGWLSHRAVAESHGLPSAGPPGGFVARLCAELNCEHEPELVRVARARGFNTLALSPECVRRLEPALDAARQAMRDYGYLVKDKKMQARPEVRPIFGVSRVLDQMVAVALERLTRAA